MLQGNDAITLNSSTRKYTKEGYLIAPAMIAKSGVLPYYARELELTDRAPNAIVKVFRSEAELAKSAPSFENKPITLDHPPDGVDASTWRELAVGDAHDVSVQRDGMFGTLVIRDKTAIDEVNKGKRQLSNGYRFAIVKAADGKPYEFEQVNIEGNHIAIVDRARCGPSCVVGDRDPITDDERQEQKPMIKLTLDGYQCEVDDTAAVAIRKMQQQITDLQTAATQAPKIKVGDQMLDQAGVDAQIAKLNTEIATLKANALTPEKFKAEYAAQQHIVSNIKDMLPNFQIGDNIDTTTLCRDALAKLIETRPAVKPQIVAVLDGVALDKAPGENLQRAVRAVHAAVIGDRAAHADRDRRTTIGRDFLSGADASITGNDAEQLDGRDAWLHRITHLQDEKPDAKAEEL
jgi:uncharacterized protein